MTDARCVISAIMLALRRSSIVSCRLLWLMGTKVRSAISDSLSNRKGAGWNLLNLVLFLDDNRIYVSYLLLLQFSSSPKYLCVVIYFAIWRFIMKMDIKFIIWSAVFPVPIFLIMPCAYGFMFVCIKAYFQHQINTSYCDIFPLYLLLYFFASFMFLGFSIAPLYSR